MTTVYKHIHLLALLFFAWSARAQVLSNQVINAGGEHRRSAATGISITDNVGEAFTESLGPVAQLMITQGFLQPQAANGITVLKNNPTCSSRDDGFISVAFSTLNRVHEERYIWSPGVACPGECGNTVRNLAPGVYHFTVVSTYTTNAGIVSSDTLRSGPHEIIASGEPCLLKVFSGVTANNDGSNDVWIIENISEYPLNRVNIYNRWGTQIFETSAYDNVTNYWPTPEMLNNLVSSTYFYIIELGDGSKPLKGWIELLKN